MKTERFRRRSACRLLSSVASPSPYVCSGSVGRRGLTFTGMFFDLSSEFQLMNLRIMPIIGAGWFSIGAFLLFNSVLNYLGDAYPEYAASVLAGNDFMRSAFGAGFPLFATAMYHKLGVDWASSLLAFLGIAFIPIPFFLWKVCTV